MIKLFYCHNINIIVIIYLAGTEVRTQFSMEEEDDLLQFAIQQSLLEVGSERDEVEYLKLLYFYILLKNIFLIKTNSYNLISFIKVDIWEALRAQKPSRPTTPNMTTEEERQLQRYENISFIRILFQIFCFYFKSSKILFCMCSCSTIKIQKGG